MHGGGSLFAVAPAQFAALGGGRDITGVTMEPAGEGTLGTQQTGFARKIQENCLRYVSGQPGVSCDLANRNGINEVNVPPNQFGKRVFRTLVNPGAEQFDGVIHRFAHNMPPKRKIRHFIPGTVGTSRCDVAARVPAGGTAQTLRVIEGLSGSLMRNLRLTLRR
jgi:hypothetical protein